MHTEKFFTSTLIYEYLILLNNFAIILLMLDFLMESFTSKKKYLFHRAQFAQTYQSLPFVKSQYTRNIK